MPEATERVLAFDFGLRYIGVASGQSITATASPVTTLSTQDGAPTWAEVKALVSEWRPTRLLVGLPLNMDDTESDMSERARRFAAQLEKRMQLPVTLVDERLSSREAASQAAEQDHNNAGSNHELAAVIIAQGYLGGYLGGESGLNNR